MQHCCVKMEGALEEYGTPLHYLPEKKSYCMDYGTVYKNVETEKGSRVLSEFLNYCPWCGIELPKKLWDEWYDEIERLGFELPLEPDDHDKIPKEYMTDEWWKKKGLQGFDLDGMKKQTSYFFALAFLA